MKSKLLFISTLLITCIFSSCGLIKKDVDNPTTPTTPTNPTDPTDPTDPQEPTTLDYYIKHPWGTGTEASWAWKKMTKQSNNYVYEGIWGGVGANINTKASDNGAEWFPESEIAGASSLYVGDGVKFTYNPNQGTLTATKTSDGGGGAIAKVRINCLSIWDKIAWGLSDDSTGEDVLLIDFSGTKGISDYYDINVSTGHTYSLFWTDGNNTSLVGGIGSGVYHEELEKGHKYTYIVSGDGESRTDDGTF